MTAHVVKDNSRMTHTFSVGTPTRLTRQGKEVIAVTSDLTPRGELAGRAGGPVRQTSYFDPVNSFVFLGSESSEPATKERPWARVTTCALEYEARAGTYPLPKRFTRHVRPDKGEKLLEYEIDYTRFEDYVPDAEDFRLEKRYGLTTPVGADWKATAGSQSAKSNRGWIGARCWSSRSSWGPSSFAAATLSSDVRAAEATSGSLRHRRSG